MLNSRLAFFTAAWHEARRPFSRSYGAILPSSLKRFHSRALEYSSRIPVSVCGTGGLKTNNETFLGSIVSLNPTWPWPHGPIVFHLKVGRIYLSPQATHLDTDIQHCAELTFSVIPKIRHLQAGTGILTCCASDTPYGLTLAPD